MNMHQSNISWLSTEKPMECQLRVNQDVDGVSIKYWLSLGWSTGYLLWVSIYTRPYTWSHPKTTQAMWKIVCCLRHGDWLGKTGMKTHEERTHWCLKEKDTPESSLFWSLPIASKHWAFQLTEVSASEMLAILQKFVSKEATSEVVILSCTWQPGCVYSTSFRPTQNWPGPGQSMTIDIN